MGCSPQLSRRVALPSCPAGLLAPRRIKTRGYEKKLELLLDFPIVADTIRYTQSGQPPNYVSWGRSEGSLETGHNGCSEKAGMPVVVRIVRA